MDIDHRLTLLAMRLTALKFRRLAGNGGTLTVDELARLGIVMDEWVSALVAVEARGQAHLTAVPTEGYDHG